MSKEILDVSKQEALPIGKKLPIDRPCSVCSAGDTKMEHHLHYPPYRTGYDIEEIDSQWARIKNQYLISPIYGGNGRVIVQEDPYKSKYECSECAGVGHVGVVCKWCLGTKYDKGKEENGYCRDCTVGAENNAAGKTLGHEPCPTCHGTGGTIVIPDENQRNTTTGQVLAISNRDILEVKVGDKVLFTNYSGSPFKFMDIDLRIIIERDLLGKVKQLKKSVEGLNEGSFADLENTGVPRE